MLSKAFRNYCGVNIGNIRTEEEWEKGGLGRWDTREKRMVGLTDSPYHACQAVKWSNVMAIENKKHLKYIF